MKHAITPTEKKIHRKLLVLNRAGKIVYMNPGKRKKPDPWHWPSARHGELLCKHGIGHDKIVDHPHGCDGCCNSKEFDVAWGKYRMEKRVKR